MRENSDDRGVVWPLVRPALPITLSDNTMRLLASHHNARVVVIATLVLGAGDIRAQGAAEVLSNDDVIQMVKGDLSRDLIVAKILGTRPGFDVTALIRHNAVFALNAPPAIKQRVAVDVDARLNRRVLLQPVVRL